jgi:hypothetical protein
MVKIEVNSKNWDEKDYAKSIPQKAPPSAPIPARL